uniref:SFRICE_022525 n=1 Tax=Spodoptera frugiperda TaxID=7108 RepID=A0A2H1X4J7_SPOFR
MFLTENMWNIRYWCALYELNTAMPCSQFSLVSSFCEAKAALRLAKVRFASSHAHDTQTRNNNLWITQRVAPCGNRTRYTMHGSELPRHQTNRNLLVFNTLPDPIELNPRILAWQSHLRSLHQRGNRFCETEDTYIQVKPETSVFGNRKPKWKPHRIASYFDDVTNIGGVNHMSTSARNKSGFEVQLERDDIRIGGNLLNLKISTLRILNDYLYKAFLEAM